MTGLGRPAEQRFPSACPVITLGAAREADIDREWFENKSEELIERVNKQLARLDVIERLVNEGKEIAEWYAEAFIEDPKQLERRFANTIYNMGIRGEHPHALRLGDLLLAKVDERVAADLNPEIPNLPTKPGKDSSYACCTIIAQGWEKRDDGFFYPPLSRKTESRDADPVDAGKVWFKRLKQRLLKAEKSQSLSDSEALMLETIRLIW